MSKKPTTKTSATAPPAPAMSAMDKLAKLKGMAPKAAPKATTKQRPILELQGADAQAFTELVECKQMAAKVKARQDMADDQAKQACFDAMTAMIWQNKSLPENPEVIVYQADGHTVDHRGVYQVKAIISLKDVKESEDPKGEILTALTAGDDDDLSKLDEQSALALINAEIVCEPQISLRYSLSQLLIGHFDGPKFIEATDAEKTMGEKLLAMVTASAEAQAATEPTLEFKEIDKAVGVMNRQNVGARGLTIVQPFTDEEREALIIQTPMTKIKSPKEFLGRVCIYAKNLHQLRRILSVIKPQFAFSGLKFAAADNDVVKHQRLMSFADDVLGRTTADADTDD